VAERHEVRLAAWAHFVKVKVIRVNSEKIYAIIPAYNVESSIGEVIDRTKGFVRRIIVVNDGSRDRTGEVALQHGVELISLPANRGKGYALRMGFCQALSNGCAAILILDADGQLSSCRGHILYMSGRPSGIPGDSMIIFPYQEG